MKSAMQDWTMCLPVMQQSVLMAAIRAPDGIRKNHPVKVLMRWYRRSIMVSAMDGKIFNDPFEEGGGSFTGPFRREYALAALRADAGLPSAALNAADAALFNEMRKVYLEHVDEIPHHFQLHLMHAAQIIGYKHPREDIRRWWGDFYLMIVNDAHLFPESEELMDRRLGDNEAQWREREEVTAR